MSAPVVFVIEVDPLDDRDFDRTREKVADVVQELVEDGVQVGGLHMAIREVREQVLAAFR